MPACLTPAVRAHVIVDAPAASALEGAAEALRATLHKVAAGVALPASGAALSALTRAIGKAGRRVTGVSVLCGRAASA